MANLTPIQQSFSAGEISPLMWQRSDTEGYKQGVAEMTNMFADSRGAAYSRTGSHYISDHVGDEGRCMSLPVSDDFFYSGFFLDKKIILSSLTGHNPNQAYNDDPHFTGGGVDWSEDTGGNGSTVTFPFHKAQLNVTNANNRYALVGQAVTVPAIGNYRIVWSTNGFLPLTLKVGTSLDDDSIHSQTVNSYDSNVVVNFTSTTLWITLRLDSSSLEERQSEIHFFGVVDEVATEVSFVTPYEEFQLAALQVVHSPSGGDIYVLHEEHPPYKLTYDRVADTFTWQLVVFTAQPSEWIVGSYPSAGDFFQGRLWLGGTVNEPQTFWGSQSGLPEDFTMGVDADDALQFTMAKYGRIEWMVGFKNLVIGTQYGEHIVTSVDDFIQSNDIQVDQQSGYGSANIQPVQVGDQIFYVSADGRKLRAIQYEWQKDNWLSKDLTFNSEHITEAGIKHIVWQQNPKNIFHCVLNDGSIASLTYERSHNVYGWSHLVWEKGTILDLSAGSIEGTDVMNAIIQNNIGTINFETQTIAPVVNYLDSWVERNPEPDGLTVTELDHLEGFTVQILVNNAVQPEQEVVGGQITLKRVYDTDSSVVVGIKFIPKVKTLPFDQGSDTGSGAAHTKRWNKIFIRLLESTKPLINGERSPERSPSTPMNEPQGNVNEAVTKINLGWSVDAQIEITQDLPHPLTILGIYGELSQHKR